ncbi:iron hydrogenase small subunit [Finegoldia magna]|uniref:iron hydrogenase small subunit n=1 Tax=Finegoldia magna TaxID=1260 RepID=UPI0024313C08|nr:iron hydrogenase small subunit [Finegoldia magna]
MSSIKESRIEILGKEVKVAAASGLANARRHLERIRDEKAHYEIIEIMACSGGCIGGAGQPLLRGNVSKLEKRMKAIHTEDRDKPIRRSYKNKSIKKIYDEYLDSPGSEKAHHLLHTEYSSR